MPKGTLTYTGNQPGVFTEDPDGVLEAPDEQRKLARAVGECFSAYRNAAKKLREGKYAHAAHLLPTHLRGGVRIFIACCEGGIVVRYERGEDKVTAGWSPQTLDDILTNQSQKVIKLHQSRDFSREIGDEGLKFDLNVQERATGKTRPLSSIRMRFDAVMELPPELPKPPHKPFCLASVRNQFEFALHLEELSEGGRAPRQVLLTTTLRAPVGWECIEIYPGTDASPWVPANAEMWAETDLLAAIVTSQMREAQLESLDPTRTARELLSTKLTAFRDLLDSNPDREEVLQTFLKENPELLCPVHTKMWPKLALGANETDFVFQEAWGEYLLVEIERSTLPLFTAKGQKRAELVHAEQQITDWVRYISDNVRTVRDELGLKGITASPKTLIVMGRDSMLSERDRQSLATFRGTTPRMEIRTYDDVYKNARAAVENVLGPIWNQVGGTRIYYVRDPEDVARAFGGRQATGLIGP